MKPLLLLQCEVLAQSLPALHAAIGETDETFLRSLATDRRVVVSRVSSGEALPPVDSIAGAIISGSSAMVADADPWIARTQTWLAQAHDAGIPLLGVCFGHQLLAHTLGGRVGPMRTGPEYASVEIRLTDEASDDPLFRALPARFQAQAAHYQTVLSPPPDASVLAEGATGIQALRFGERAWGVQFHPEFRASDLAVLIEAIRPRLTAAGSDVDFDLQHLQESPHAQRVLPLFHEISLSDRSR